MDIQLEPIKEEKENPEMLTPEEAKKNIKKIKQVLAGDKNEQR